MLRPFMPTLTGALALGLSTAVLATPVNLNLPAQPLSTSLTQLGQASGLRMSFDTQSVAGKQAPA